MFKLQDAYHLYITQAILDYFKAFHNYDGPVTLLPYERYIKGIGFLRYVSTPHLTVIYYQMLNNKT